MFFRNLTLFRFAETLPRSLKKLPSALDEHRLRPCGPMELATRGFVSPFGRDSEELTHQIGAFTLATIGGEDRLLPSVVVNEELATRLAKIAEKQGRRVGAKERKQLKEEVISELLPRAFIRPSRLSAYLDAEQGWLVIDTASRKAAEEAVNQFREAMGRFPAVPATAEESPRVLMTDWLIHGKLPKGLALADECELRDPAEAGAVVRCRRQDLESDEVREHLKSGKQVFQLGLIFDERIGFVLGEDLVVRKLRFLDGVLDALDEDAAESPKAELDAQFALMSLELRRLLDNMHEWFGLPRPGIAISDSGRLAGEVDVVDLANDYLELATAAGDKIKVLRKSHPRARRLRLTVTSGGARVTYPEGTHPAQVVAFLRKHGEWLERKLDELSLGSAPPVLKVGAATVMPLRGETTRLSWRDGAYPHIELNGDRLVLTLPRPHGKATLPAARALLRSFLEAQIRRDVSRYLARYCPDLGRAPTAVKLRPLKSLWGSLDTRDRVMLDLALALAPPAALRYVVVHELCHLRIRSHSPRFWALVEKLYPEWREQRDWLRVHGQALKAELARLVQR